MEIEEELAGKGEVNVEGKRIWAFSIWENSLLDRDSKVVFSKDAKADAVLLVKV